MKKEKIETAEQFQKRKEKEAKEIVRLEKELAKPKLPGYLFYFVAIITIVFLVDEVTTNVGTQMGTIIANAFFSTGDGGANAIRSVAETIITLAAAVAMVMRPLSDRYGRKPFLILYTLGMGLGMFIICISTKWPGWFVGSFIIQFCTPHDMQTIYIQECAPQKRRGTFFSISKGLASFGILLIPVLRQVFGVGSTHPVNGWRNVYFVLALIAVVFAILAGIFMRESDVYINNRLTQLRRTEEERKELKEKEKQDSEKYGLIQGFKHIFRNKQLLWIGLAFGFVFFAYQLTSNYDVIAKNFWGLKQVGESFDVKMFDSSADIFNATLSAEGDAYVTKVLTLWGFGAALVQIFPGIIADKIGRKKATIFFGVGALVFYILFYLGSYNTWNPLLTGFFIGCSCGAIWAYGDLLLLMTSESTETNLRVSVNTSIYIFSGIFRGIGMGVFAVLTLIFKDMAFAPVTLAMTLVGLVIGTILLFLKVKDTKDVDMEHIKSSDFNK